MAGTVESFIFRMIVENGQFVRGMKQSSDATKQAAKETQQAARETEKATSSMTGSMGRLSDAIRGGAGALFLKSTTDAYRDLNNVMNTATAVFGENAAAIEEWADNSVEGLGLSKRAAIEAVTLIAGLGKEAGFADEKLVKFSESIVGLAADLGAAFNTTTLDAVKAIQSGFSGSSIEPLRKYNIVINDTILKTEYLALTGEKVSGVLSTQQRMMAFLSLLYKKSADYIGQWAVESNSLLGAQQKLAAQWENFRATLGKSLAEPLTNTLNLFTSLLEKFGQLNEATSGVAGSVTVMAVAWIAFAPALRAVGSAALGAAKGLKNLFTTAETGSKALSTTNAAMLVLTIALAAWNFQQRQRQKENEKDVKAMHDYATGTIEVSEAMDELLAMNKRLLAQDSPWEDGPFVANFAPEEMDKFIDKFRELAKTTPELAMAMLNNLKNTRDGAKAVEEYGINVDELNKIMKEEVEAQAAAAKAAQDFQMESAAMTGTILRNEDAARDYAGALAEVAAEADAAKGNIEKMLDEASKEFVQDFDPLIARLELNKLAVERLGIIEKINDKETEAADLAEAQLDLANNLRDTRAQLVAIMDANVSAIEDQNNTQLEGLDLINAQIDALEGLKLEPGMDVAEIDALIAEIEARRPQLEVQAALAEGDLSHIGSLIDQLGADPILLEMLIGAGITEEQANTALKAIPEDKKVEILLDTAEAAKDAEALDDEDFVANVTLKAIEDELNTTITEYRPPSDVTVPVEGDLVTIEGQLRTFRRIQEQDDITIPIRFRTTGSVPLPPGAETESEAATATAFGVGTRSGYTDANGQIVYGRAARAGQPIVVNNYTQNVTMPPGASPAEVVAALRTWERRNGKASSVR